MAKYTVPPLAERFWKKVQKTDSCWLWTAGKNQQGYGQFFIEARAKGQGKFLSTHRLAHRVAWQLTYGPIPDGLDVCHHCDRPLCCNPTHLFLGTHLDNMRDMDAKGRRKSTGRQGEHHNLAKLTEADVLAIRARHAAGGITQRALAKQYGVSNTAIMYVIHRKNWRHI